MDAAICMIEPGSCKGTFAGARLSLTVSSAQEVTRIRGDRISLGYTDTPIGPRFQEVQFAITENTILFLHTDGIIDQIGGPRRIAFGYNQFAHLIEQKDGENLDDILVAVDNQIQAYAADESRRDDLTVIALRAK